MPGQPIAAPDDPILGHSGDDGDERSVGGHGPDAISWRGKPHPEGADFAPVKKSQKELSAVRPLRRAFALGRRALLIEVDTDGSIRMLGHKAYTGERRYLGPSYAVARQKSLSWLAREVGASSQHLNNWKKRGIPT